MTESLFGIPINPTVNNTPFAPEALAFSQWLEGVFEPVGKNGAPNPSTDPMGCYHYLNNRRKTILQSVNQSPLVRLADKNLNIVGELTDYISCSSEELMADSGQAKCVIKAENWLVDWILNQNSIYEDIHLFIDPIPTKPDWRTRWGGKITEINVKRNEDGTGTIELQAISMREHCKHLLFAANPIFPPEAPAPAGCRKAPSRGRGFGLPKFNFRACGSYRDPYARSYSCRCSSTWPASSCRDCRSSQMLSTLRRG